MQAPYPMQDPKRPQALNSGTNVQECRICISSDAFDRLRALFSVHLASCKGAVGASGALDWGAGCYLFIPNHSRRLACSRRLRSFNLDHVSVGLNSRWRPYDRPLSCGCTQIKCGSWLACEGGLPAGLSSVDVHRSIVGAGLPAKAACQPACLLWMYTDQL